MIKEKTSRGKVWRRLLLAVVLLATLCLNGIGLYFGNLLYQEASLLNSHWNDQTGSPKIAPSARVISTFTAIPASTFY